VEPPGPIPNPEVKRLSANGSGTIGPVRVGRRQVFARIQLTLGPGSFFAYFPGVEFEDCPENYQTRWHLPWLVRRGTLETRAMTRPAIERCIHVFIVALIATFIWTVTKVLAMVGWF
jgi:hypothetical protein